MNKNSINNEPTLVPNGNRRPDLAPGHKLGRYVVIKLLGRGGMGQVYLVQHEMQRTLHALKILPAEFSGRPGFVERFRIELQTMARLQHENIVHVTHSDEENGLYYLVMDFVAADDTDEPYDLEEALAVEKRLSPETVRRLMLQICEGLKYAHGSGVVHRDLKPANILLSSKNLSQANVRITDFGLARVVGEDQIRTMIAQSIQRSMSLGDQDTFVEKRRVERSSNGAVLGTYGYMSPEQEEGKSADERSDLYALGVMMYRMITGQRLRGRAKPASALVPGLDVGWDAIIDRCLEMEPEDRFQSVEELEKELGDKKGRSSKVLKFGSSKVGGGASRVKRVVAALVVLGLVAVVSIYSVKSISTKEWPVTLEKVIGPESGNNWTSTSTGMEFVWVPALKMWVGKYEVTNGEYRKKELRHDSKEYKGHSLNGERQPVDHATYADAVAYAGWLTERDHADGKLPAGYSYRLPTEDEWLTFAQCGDGREYPWGDNWPPRSGQAGNYHGSEGASTLSIVDGSEGASKWSKIDGYSDGHAVTCNVEDSWSNPWGLYGVGGNVWECASAKSQGNFGVWRGGSWGIHDQDFLRCSCGFSDDEPFQDLGGFRLVLSR